MQVVGSSSSSRSRMPIACRATLASGSRRRCSTCDSAFRATQRRAPGARRCPGSRPSSPFGHRVHPRARRVVAARVAPAPPLTGDYGKTFGPRIVSFVADDFDNGDDIYGSRDTRRSPSTSRPTAAAATSRQPVVVTEMLSFSHPLGDDVLSQWSDDSTLPGPDAVSAAGVEDNPPLLGKTIVRRSARCVGMMYCAGRDRGAVSGRTSAAATTRTTSRADPPRVGDRVAPSITWFVGDDPDARRPRPRVHDVLLVSLGHPDRPRKGDPFGGKAWVDDLLWFSLPIGDDPAGASGSRRTRRTTRTIRWSSDCARSRLCSASSTRVRSASAARSSGPATRATRPRPPPPPSLPGTASACAAPSAPVGGGGSEAYWSQTLVTARGDAYDNDGDGNGGEIRNRAGTSRSRAPAGLSRRPRWTMGAPLIVGFDADDPNSARAATYSDGDVLTITFDRAVDRTDVTSDAADYAGRGPSITLRVYMPSRRDGPLGRGVERGTSTAAIVVDDASGVGSIERGATRVHASVRDDAVRLRNRAGCQGVPVASWPDAAARARGRRRRARVPRAAAPRRRLPRGLRQRRRRVRGHDTITVRFDREPTAARARESRAARASSTRCSPALGARRRRVGTWSNDGVDFIVVLLEAGNGGVSPRIVDANGTVVRAPTYVSVVGDVRSLSGKTRARCGARRGLLVLVGSVGDNSSTAFLLITSVGDEKRARAGRSRLGLDTRDWRSRRTRLPRSCGVVQGLPLSTTRAAPLHATEEAAGRAQLPRARVGVSGVGRRLTFVTTTTFDAATPGPPDSREGPGGFSQIGSTDYLYTSGIVVNGTQYCDVQPQFSPSRVIREKKNGRRGHEIVFVSSLPSPVTSARPRAVAHGLALRHQNTRDPVHRFRRRWVRSSIFLGAPRRARRGAADIGSSWYLSQQVPVTNSPAAGSGTRSTKHRRCTGKAAARGSSRGAAPQHAQGWLVRSRAPQARVARRSP